MKGPISLAAEQCHNDSEEEIRSLARRLASINREIPLHLSFFFPRYRMTDKPTTPVEQVYLLVDVARGRLFFVYTGNC